MRSTSNNINEIETQRQLEFINELREIYDKEYGKTGIKRTFRVETFGCQMNFKDSEKIAGVLTQSGYEETTDEVADFVIFNTCTIRENANHKIYGRLGYLGTLKDKKPDMIIAICGCMMQEPAVVEKIKKSYSFVDIIFGTHNIYKLAELIKIRRDSRHMVIDLLTEGEMIVEDLPSERKYSFKAGVNIILGCNNFCTYCIVPYVRGRERSRNVEDIIKEIEEMVKEGVIEIMLLGQNVNSYGKDLETPVSFAKLLEEVDKVKGVKRIRFMTSNPKDLSDELIEVIKNSKNVCNHIHLPIQSGSSRLLKLMNRHYTKESYIDVVNKLRNAIPDISITTDFIVGFPGETDEDFDETIDLVRQVGFTSAYSFVYSKRTGTPAATMDGQVSEEVIKERFPRLLDEIRDNSQKFTMNYKNTIQEVLVDEINEQRPELVSGRLSNNVLVHFEGNEEYIGKLMNVEIISNENFYYMGKLHKEDN